MQHRSVGKPPSLLRQIRARYGGGPGSVSPLLRSAGRPAVWNALPCPAMNPGVTGPGHGGLGGMKPIPGNCSAGSRQRRAPGAMSD
jgi:hypothetical protein